MNAAYNYQTRTWTSQKASMVHGSWNMWVDNSSLYLNIFSVSQWKCGASCRSLIRSVAHSHRERCGTSKCLISSLYGTDTSVTLNYILKISALLRGRCSRTHGCQLQWCLIPRGLDIWNTLKCEQTFTVHTGINKLDQPVWVISAYSTLEEDLCDQEVLLRSKKGPPGSEGGTLTLGGGAGLIQVEAADLGRSVAPRIILSSNLVRHDTISDICRRCRTSMGCWKGYQYGNNGLIEWSFKLGWGLQGGWITKIGINIDVIIVEATAHWKEEGHWSY